MEPSDTARERCRWWWVAPLLAIVALLLFWQSFQVWFAALLGVVFAVMLDWLARLVSGHTPIGRTAALIVVVSVLVGLACGLGLWLGPPVVSQVNQLIDKVPEGLDATRQWLAQRGWGVTVLEQLRQWAHSTTGSQVGSRVMAVVGSVLDMVTGVLIVAFVALFLVATPDVYRKGVLALVPPRHVERAEELMHRVAIAWRWWLLGRVVSMTIVGVFTSIGLWLAGVPLPWALGFIAGLLSFVPNLGPIAAAGLGLLLAMLAGPWTVLWALVVYVGVQLIESYAITPMVQRYAVSVPPALLIVVQLVMGLVFGLTGLIVATPLMVSVIVAVQLLYVRDRLGKDVALMGEH